MRLRIIKIRVAVFNRARFPIYFREIERERERSPPPLPIFSILRKTEREREREKRCSHEGEQQSPRIDGNFFVRVCDSRE